jgi:hypothetical protein
MFLGVLVMENLNFRLGLGIQMGMFLVVNQTKLKFIM